jgi:3-oxoadipate enol-lactonase
VLVPGVQGRWEWMRPAVEALSRRCRAITYSMGSATTLDDLSDEIDRVLDERGIESAAICGVSFGGVVALRYAARRPSRTSALVLVSAPSPKWRPNDRQAQYLARPWLSTPAFVASSPLRMWPEIVSAIPSRWQRTRFTVTHGLRVVTHPVVPATMAGRIELMRGEDLCADCGKISAPTLIVTGDEALDRVVPAADTREYARLIRGAHYVKMDRTGHIGFVTQPERFAAVVTDFAHANNH